MKTMFQVCSVQFDLLVFETWFLVLRALHNRVMKKGASIEIREWKGG